MAQGAGNIFFQGNYFDNGHVDLYSPGVSIKGSYLLHNTAVATFSDNNFIRIYANGQVAPYQLDLESILTQIASPDQAFAYLSCPSSNTYCNTGTTYNWTGDYTGLAAFTGNQVLANLRADEADEFICHSATQTIGCLNFYKPTGSFVENFQVGNSTPSTIAYALGSFTIGDPLTTLDIGGPLSLSTGGPMSAASWTTNGLAVSGSARTLTDTTGSGTIGAEAGAALPTYTIAASAAGVTITNLDELYLPAPVAGTNVTAGTLWSLHTAAGIRSGGILTGALGENIFGATASINNNSNFNTQVNTGTSTGNVAIGNTSGPSTTTMVGATTINASANAATSLNTGTSTGAVHIADGSGNNAVTIGNGTGSVSIKAPLISAAGTAFTVASGTATCGTTSTLHGGVQAGDFTCTTAGTAASTVTLTIAATTTAYTCWGRDITTPTTVTQTGAKSTTSVTLTLTSVTANDVIQFGCLGY